MRLAPRPSESGTAVTRASPTAPDLIPKSSPTAAVPTALREPLPLRPGPPDLYLPREPTPARDARPPGTWVVWTLLGGAILLPTDAGAPWELIARPLEVTLQAFATLILLIAIELGPRTERIRSRLALIAGTLLLPFALLSASATAAAFDGPPAFERLFAGAAPTLGWLAVPGLVLVVGGLFALPGARRWIAASLVIAGLASLVVTALTLELGALVPPDSPFVGDRVAAWVMLAPLALAVGAGAIVAWPRAKGLASPWAWALWASAHLPLLVLALFAAKSDHWVAVLAPLKLVLFLGALGLHGATALGALATNTRPRARTLTPRA